jgi:hypothetical protein
MRDSMKNWLNSDTGILSTVKKVFFSKNLFALEKNKRQ